MKIALGIDLGTTNSVASVYRKGNIETLLIEGSKTFPSVVSFKDEKTMLLGHAAKKRLFIDPEHSVGSVKRFMGDREKTFTLYGKKYTPVDISSFILKRIAIQAQEILSTTIEDAIITVPAYFDNNQKSDTLAAGKAAGLNVLRLVPEPTAAAIAYGLDKGKDQTIMVYDLGGGTFDVSILKIVGNVFTVIAVDGDAHLGGDDFDSAIVTLLEEKIKEKHGIDLKSATSAEALMVRQKLKEAAERAKCELSEARSAEIALPEIMGISLEETLTRERYDDLIRPFLNITINKIRTVLKEAKLDKRDIDRVILVGGSTRNLAVRDIVAEEIKEPFISEEVDTEVSRGAAIVAASLSLPKEDFAPLEVRNVTAHSLGLRVSKGKKTDKFKELIKRQTPVPAKVAERFTTYRDNQNSVEVAVFQGEHDQCSKNTFIGGFVLKGIPPRKKGVPDINVDFEMDISDILHVRATCGDASGTIALNINQVSESEISSGKSEQVVLLIDLSYSMEGWKLETTKKAVRSFIEIKKKNRTEGDRVGCVVFHSSAEIISPLIEDFDKIKSRVEDMKVKGTTNMALGLQEALRCLDGKTNGINRIIMLSDGAPDNTSKVQSILPGIVKRQIRVDTVGAGKDYNRVLLQEIADKTGGQFEAADNINALITAFMNLAES